MSAQISLPLRRVQRDKRLGINESDFHTVETEQRLPLDGCALVLVDVWDRHHIVSHQQRCDRLTHSTLVPLLAAARTSGLTVIHAPGPEVAWKYPQCPPYDRSIGDQWLGVRPSDWPPADYRQRRGDFASFWRDSDPVMPADVAQLRADRRIAAAVEPLATEPVVATGTQLVDELAARQKLIVFYAGFAANICLPFRDYGMRAVRGLGYDVVLVRDATTAVETAATIDHEDLLAAAVADVEMNLGHSTLSRALIRELTRL